MYKLKSLINDSCNMEINYTFDTLAEVKNTLETIKHSVESLLGPKEYTIVQLTQNVTVYTLNLGDDNRVYTFYLIYEEDKIDA